MMESVFGYVDEFLRPFIFYYMAIYYWREPTEVIELNH